MMIPGDPAKTGAKGEFVLARPVKWRRINHMPSVLEFGPATADPAAGKNVILLEELEAIRLKDVEGLEQADCARQMEISRPTFQRILLAARENIADSLINGKALQIEGGHYTRSICPVRCMACGREWDESVENIESENATATTCPRCHSNRLQCRPDERDGQDSHCNQRCHRYGQQAEHGH
jgi:uncharacterized protein